MCLEAIAYDSTVKTLPAARKPTPADLSAANDRPIPGLITWVGERETATGSYDSGVMPEGSLRQGAGETTRAFQPRPIGVGVWSFLSSSCSTLSDMTFTPRPIFGRPMRFFSRFTSARSAALSGASLRCFPCS